MSKSETVNLKQQVIQYYLTAPLQEIEDLQDTIRVIYDSRKSMALSSKIAAGRVRAAKEKAKGSEALPSTPVVKKGKGKKVAIQTAGEISGFGGKQTVEDESIPTQATA